MNGRFVNPAEMYKESLKQIAALTEELTRERERSKAVIQDLEAALARREKDLDEERHLRKQVEKNAEEVEKNADERIKSARQDLETELAKLRDSLAKRGLEQAEDLARDEERLSESDTQGHYSNLRTDGPGLSPNNPIAIVQKSPIVPIADAKYQVKTPSIPDGKYLIQNRAKDFYWNSAGNKPVSTVYFHPTTIENAKTYNNMQVNNRSPIIQVFWY